MQEIQNGKSYKIMHRRKGYFSMRVSHAGIEWIDGEVIGDNPTEALVPGNEYRPGEKITVRKSNIVKAEEIQ